ncbi:MAG: hypothetical protein EXQ85_01220 [Alphaproteobacteria bacterium]|nr:hypothetical protein [Alphaproteobacteria bacterium]
MLEGEEGRRAAESLWRSPPTVRRAYADYRYGQLHYRVARPERSTKVPLFLFHQTGSSGRCYEGLIADMGSDRVAVVADTPASGASDPLPHPPAIGDFAAAMEELLDHFAFNVAPVYSDGELAHLRSLDRVIETSTLEGAHVRARWQWIRENTPDNLPLALRELEFVESLRAGPLAYHGHHAAFSYQHSDNLPKVEQTLLILHAGTTCGRRPRAPNPLSAMA